ncbi:MAG: hypothetical protein IH611_11065, partial [Deltaproteobacteria bacterium]|nr:hypothetical protein [Deltaproteobacteria bacterium]
MCLLLWYAAPACAQKIPHDAPAILSAAEALFQTMKSRDYPSTWRILTAKSRDRIVSDTIDAIRRTGGPPVPMDRIREDFA